MTAFYLLLLALSGAYLGVQLAVWLFFGRTLFPNAGELFERRKSRLEWQTVFPKNLLRLVVFIFVTSLFGIMLEAVGAASWLGLPCAAAGGLAFNFLLSTVFSPLYYKLHKQGEPSPAELENMDGIVTEDISPDMYGEIKVSHGGRSYYFRAVSANGRELPAGTAVIVIYCEDSACFVESAERFYDVLFDEEQPEITPELPPDKPELSGNNNEIGRA